MFFLELSEEQKMIQDTAKSFAAEQMRPKTHDCDEKRSIPDDLLASA